MKHDAAVENRINISIVIHIPDITIAQLRYSTVFRGRQMR